jgi:hypothetical protein
MFLSLGSSVQDTAHRGAADLKTTGDFGFAEAGTAEFADLIGLKSRREGTAQTLAVGSRVGKAGTDAFAQNLSFELSEDSEQASHGAAGGRGQIESLGE